MMREHVYHDPHCDCERCEAMPLADCADVSAVLEALRAVESRLSLARLGKRQTSAIPMEQATTHILKALQYLGKVPTNG